MSRARRDLIAICWLHRPTAERNPRVREEGHGRCGSRWSSCWYARFRRAGARPQRSNLRAIWEGRSKPLCSPLNLYGEERTGIASVRVRVDAGQGFCSDSHSVKAGRPCCVRCADHRHRSRPRAIPDQLTRGISRPPYNQALLRALGCCSCRILRAPPAVVDCGRGVGCLARARVMSEPGCNHWVCGCAWACACRPSGKCMCARWCSQWGVQVLANGVTGQLRPAVSRACAGLLAGAANRGGMHHGTSTCSRLPDDALRDLAATKRPSRGAAPKPAARAPAPPGGGIQPGAPHSPARCRPGSSACRLLQHAAVQVQVGLRRARPRPVLAHRARHEVTAPPRGAVEVGVQRAVHRGLHVSLMTPCPSRGARGCRFGRGRKAGVASGPLSPGKLRPRRCAMQACGPPTPAGCEGAAIHARSSGTRAAHR